MRTIVTVAAAGVIGLLGARGARGQVLDRVVAIVGGQAITLSDVRAARQLHLVATGGGGDAEVIDRLVVR